MRQRFDGYSADVAQRLNIRQDHCSQYMSDNFQAEIHFLGMKDPPAVVREPEGNRCKEWFICTLKENLLWIDIFKTIEELRLTLLQFKALYDSQWLLERRGSKTPAQVREEQLGVNPFDRTKSS